LPPTISKLKQSNFVALKALQVKNSSELAQLQTTNYHFFVGAKAGRGVRVHSYCKRGCLAHWMSAKMSALTAKGRGWMLT